MDDVRNQDLIAAQPVTKRLDLVDDAQCKVMVSEREAKARALLHFGHKIRHVERCADVEERLVEPAKELKRFASWPILHVDIPRHRRKMIPTRSHEDKKTGAAFATPVFRFTRPLTQA